MASRAAVVRALEGDRQRRCDDTDDDGDDGATHEDDKAEDVLCLVTREPLEHAASGRGEGVMGLLHAFVMMEGEGAPREGSAGAASSFVGATRGTFKGRKVVHLSYECYEPMAIKVMEEVCREAMTAAGEELASGPSSHPSASAPARGVSRVAVVHRIGVVPVGEASIVIMASAPHRLASIRCVEYIIDNVKARAPIWKREIYDDGSEWKENAEWQMEPPVPSEMKASMLGSRDVCSSRYFTAAFAGMIAGATGVFALNALFNRRLRA